MFSTTGGRYVSPTSTEVRNGFSADPEHWRGPAVLTTYRSLGLLSARPHPFLNRGTYNQLAVVDVAGRQTDGS